MILMHETDLTKGNIFASMTLFALPMFVGNLLQQAYNVVDTWVVGRYIGADALAGVGASFTLMTFLTSILLGLCMGSGIVFSLHFGRKDTKSLEESVGTAWILILLVSLVLTLVPLLAVDSIMAWLHIPEEILSLTRVYLQVIFCGIPAVFCYNFFGAYLKSVGNALVPLLFLGVATLLNILLDVLFIVVFAWGTGGAALATIIAQYFSGVGMGVYVLVKAPSVRRALAERRWRPDCVKEISRYSLFTCLQQSVMNLGILMVQGLVNSFGSVTMAAFAVAVKIDAFAYMPAQEYANAFAIFTAQNVGAGRLDRVRAGMRCGAMTSFSYCMVASGALWLFARPLMEIFVSSEQETIIQQGVTYLHIEGSFYVLIGGLFLFYALYRALGKPQFSLVLTVVSLGTRVALAYALAPRAAFGVCAIWWAIPIGWLLADLVGLGYLLTHRQLYQIAQPAENRDQ